MPALHGVGVLVTRPGAQSAPLCRLLEVQGARTFVFPAIEIVPLASVSELGARLELLPRFDLAIFTSANAVRYGAALLERQPHLKLAAIGPATARALEQAGYRVSVQPGQGFDSESLLRSLCGVVAGQHVLLIKGSAGRELLIDELTRLGASVTVADVYRRERPRPSPAEIAALESHFAAHAIQLVTATSLEIAENLFALASPALRGELAAADWVVAGERVARSVRALGAAAAVVAAASALDQDLVAAVVRWRAAESGA